MAAHAALIDASTRHPLSATTTQLRIKLPLHQIEDCIEYETLHTPDTLYRLSNENVFGLIRAFSPPTPCVSSSIGSGSYHPTMPTFLES
jgi:hypothetical protein